MKGAISFLELRTEAVVGSIRVLNDLLDVALIALGTPEQQRHDLALGLAELVANVCEHELANGDDGAVTVSLDVRSGDLELHVCSQGPRFDLDAALERASQRNPLDDLLGSGLGLPLLVGLFDAVEHDYEDGRGNRITLRKRRAG